MLYTASLSLTVGYDGTDYHGWAVQPVSRGPTIQRVMQERLRLLTGESLQLVGASRTDAGVHARGQVVALTTDSRIPLERWPQAANNVLPKDIVVLKAEEARPGFDPRREAVEKTYTYSIYYGPTRDVFKLRFGFHIREPLETDLMSQAAAYFIGTHDFRSFAAAGGSAKTSTRTVYRCEVQKGENGLKITVTANGFLYRMVRIMVGTLLMVGRRKLTPEAIPGILNGRRRELSGPTVPACGLCLEEILF